MHYYSLVQAEKWVFPDFSDCCPICHGRDCAVRIGFYYRTAFDIFLMVYITDLPIARYKCQRKRKPLVKDLTFSLLPHCLIPYLKPTIPSFMDIIYDKYHHKKSTEKILDKLYMRIAVNSFNLSARSLLRYYQLFHQTVIKIKLAWKENIFKPPPDFPYLTMHQITEYIQNYPGTDNRPSALVMSDYYYQQQNGYFNNAQFLFGTAYQFL
jgi:hypothetical protein